MEGTVVSQQILSASSISEVTDSSDVLKDIRRFLGALTPEAWLEGSEAMLDTLLVDHAQCEKKAAAAAMQLMFRYPQDSELCLIMSKLAREELRHYEQVSVHMRRLGINDRQQAASRYAASLKSHIRKADPERLVDALLVGALIEARSCERFAALVPWIRTFTIEGAEALADFYAGLLASEGRHFRAYLKLAEARSPEPIDVRLNELKAVENELIASPDELFRFHSGPLTVQPTSAAAELVL